MFDVDKQTEGGIGSANASENTSDGAAGESHPHTYMHADHHTVMPSSSSCFIATSAILNSAGGMGEGGLSTPEEGDTGEGGDGGIGHKTQVNHVAPQLGAELRSVGLVIELFKILNKVFLFGRTRMTSRSGIPL